MNGRVVVVTGGTAGVGRATAVRFAKEGASVALLARGEERLEAAKRELEAHGVRAVAHAVDVADAGAVEAAADRVERELGPIDVWVNNAMATVFAEVWETEPEEFRRATEVTYLGSVWGTMAALRRMRPRDRGVIVQVGSALAYRGIPLQAAYCGGKHALQGFLESLRTELMHDGSHVQLTMVQLPALNTPQFTWSRAKMPHEPQPVPPIFQPEVAADAIVFAANHPRREMMVGWPTVKAIVGNAVAPDRRRPLPRRQRLRRAADRPAARRTSARATSSSRYRATRERTARSTGRRSGARSSSGRRRTAACSASPGSRGWPRATRRRAQVSRF